MRSLIALLVAVAANVSVPALASPITVGSLYRADGSSTINDSLNDRIWLGWERTVGLTYAQISAAVGVGGMFEGYTIARNIDAQLFVDALVGGPHACTASSGSTCSGITREAGDLVGESYSFDPIFDYDWSYFLSDNGVGQDIGFVRVFVNSVGVNSRVEKVNEAFTFDTADSLPDGTSWMLYQTTASAVPEPGSLGLVALALFAAGCTNRRAKVTPTGRIGEVIVPLS